MIRLFARLVAGLCALTLATGVAAQSLAAPSATRIDSGRGDVPEALASDAAGNAYVVGTVDDTKRATQFAVAKVSPQGRVVWRTHDNGAIGGPAGKALSVAVDRQGHVYATGWVLTTVGITSTRRNILAAFDANGTQLWSRAVGGTKVAVDAADRIVVTGPSGDTAQFNAGGTMLWSRAATGIAVTDMRLDATGSALIAGVALGKTNLGASSIVALKLDPQGNLVWRSSFAASDISDDDAWGIAPAPDGSAYVVGTTALDASGEIAAFPLLLKFDGLGLVSVVGVGAAYGGTDVDVGAAGDITVFGTGVVSRLDPSGAIRWTRSVPTLSQAMAVAANGDVFVSGTLASSRVSAAGDVEPPVTFTDPGRASAQTVALAVTPSGTLLAAGITRANALSTSPDILVLRYAAGDGQPTPPVLQPPAAPSNLSAAARNGGNRLSWRDNANNEEGFRIERCALNNCTNFALIGSTAANATSFTDSDVVRGITYRYRVRAFNAAGSSAPSNAEAVRAR